MPEPLTDYQTQVLAFGSIATGTVVLGLCILVFLLAIHVTRHI